MRSTAVCLALSLLALSVRAADDFKPTGDAIVPKGARAELIARVIALADGPTVGAAARRGARPASL